MILGACSITLVQLVESKVSILDNLVRRCINISQINCKMCSSKYMYFYSHTSTVYFSFSQMICIRQEAGMCCTKYSPCGDSYAYAFNGAIAESLVGTSCVSDYLDFVSKLNRACQKQFKIIRKLLSLKGEHFNFASYSATVTKVLLYPLPYSCWSKVWGFTHTRTLLWIFTWNECWWHSWLGLCLWYGEKF